MIGIIVEEEKNKHKKNKMKKMKKINRYFLMVIFISFMVIWNMNIERLITLHLIK